MVEILGIGVESETTQAYEEGRSVLGSLVTRLLAIVHRIMDFALNISRQLYTYASEHPLAMTLGICNLIIWMS